VSTSWLERYADKVVSAERAIQTIPPGRRILLGSGAAEPVALVNALIAHGTHLADNEIVHLLTLGPAPYVRPEFSARFRHVAFFIGQNVRAAVQDGRADFMPVFLSDIPRLIGARRVPIDVVLLQVSAPDAHGYVSLGVSVDIVRAAVNAASVVIAQVNPRMPRTHGDSFIPVRDITWLVPVEEPLLEAPRVEADPVSRAIGEYVAGLVPDGATIQTGIGKIPEAVLSALRDHHDLGVHTEMFSDSMIDLVESGAVTGKRKTLLPGKIVTSFVMGSRRLYDWVHENAAVEFRGSDFTNDPLIIARNERMIAINSALAVDLTGQVAADAIQGKFFSGIGGQVDFIRGAARSPGGKPIIAMPATACAGQVSRIEAAFDAGAGVVTSRGDVHYVVTEYGIAQLWGKSVRERTAALIEIAHPDVRADLLNEAKQRHYVLPDQPLPNPQSRLPERIVALRSSDQVRIRPVRISDEDALQELLYRLSDESTFFRFFGHAAIHPHREVLRLVELAGDCGVAFVAESTETEELLGIARADLDSRSGVAELGLTVADPWQNKGVGGLLLEALVHAARTSGFRALVADVLPANGRMQRLLRRAGFTCSGEPDGPWTFRLGLSSEAPRGASGASLASGQPWPS